MNQHKIEHATIKSEIESKASKEQVTDLKNGLEMAFNPGSYYDLWYFISLSIKKRGHDEKFFRM